MKNANLLSIKPDKPGKSRIKAILLPIAVLAALSPMALGIGGLAYGGYRVLSDIQQEGLVLGMGFSATCSVVFVFSIFYVISVFYFSKDIESLLPLPLKPSEILAAKFTVTLLYEYLTELILLAPVLIGYGAASGAGITYYLYGLLIFLTMPILPLAYSSILSMVVMRFTGLARNRDRFRIISGILVMLLSVALNLVIGRFGNSSMDPEMLQQLMNQGDNSLVKLISGIFFSNRFAVTAMLHSASVKGLVNLSLYILISGFFVMLLLSVGEMMYFKGVVGMSEASAKRKKYTESELRKFSGEQPIIWSYTMKELKLLFRTPVYFMNCVLMNFIFPVFIVLPFLIQPEEMNELKTLAPLIAGGKGSAIALAAAFGICTFVSTSNGITATAISREGSNIFVSKYLPVSYKTQIMAKVLSGISLSAVSMLMLLLTALLFLPIPAYLILLMAFTGALGILFSSFTGILFDLAFPKLVWDNEQKAVKQNLNVVFNMLASIVIAGIPIFVSIALTLPLWTTFFLITVLFGALDILLYVMVSTVGVRMFERIEG
jgi:ABC-2 type transport system permease protein